MTNPSLAEMHLLFGYVILLVGVLTGALLWRLRSPAVLFWCGGVLLQAAAAILLAMVGEARPAPLLMGVLAVAALAANLAKAEAVRRLAGVSGRWWPWLAVATAFALLVAAVERRAPAIPPVFVIVVAGSVLSMVGLYWVLRSTAGRIEGRGIRVMGWLTLVQAGLLILSMISALASGQDPMDLTGKSGTLAGNTLTLLLPVAVNVLFIRLVFDQQLRRYAEAQERIAQAELAQGRFEERERLLSDIHDGFGSLLATARVRLSRPGAGTAEAVQLLEECLSDLQLTVDTLQEDGDSLAADFSNLRYRYQQRLAGLGPELAWDLRLNEAPPVPPTMRLQILRVVQEALGNALRHASSRVIRITATWETASQQLRIAVEDDGDGMPAQVEAGRGLTNMRRRARLLGTELRLSPGADGRGTCLSLDVPIGPAAVSG